MLELKYRTHGNANPQGKPRVYFTCHPSDFDRCFERLSQDLFSAQDCAVYYTEDMTEAIPQEDREIQLKRMNLFVIPVSLKLLVEPNRAMDEDFAFAVENQIPVLPIVLEAGLDPIYSREDRFADRNYLSLDGVVDSGGVISFKDSFKQSLLTIRQPTECELPLIAMPS